MFCKTSTAMLPSTHTTHTLDCAGDPTASKDFCEACICTVFANFVPATLQSAGILTNSTPPGAADEAIGSCAPSSHVALLQLGALTEAWSAALNSRCNEMTPHSPEGACKQYTPKALPVKKAATAATAAARTTTRCPFDAEDIKPKELQAAQEACGEFKHSTYKCFNARRSPHHRTRVLSV